jgi:hypothetical protein
MSTTDVAALLKHTSNGWHLGTSTQQFDSLVTIALETQQLDLLLQQRDNQCNARLVHGPSTPEHTIHLVAGGSIDTK